MKQFVYAILPRFSSQAGHILHYHLSVEKAVRSLGWEYTAFVPKKTEYSPLPKNWENCLANDTSSKRKNLFFKGMFLFANILPFRRIFRRKEATIIFIEHFELLHLASIAFALFFFTPMFRFWILHRYDFNQKKKILLYRIFHWYIEKKVGKENVRFLTDSQLLAQELKKMFRRTFLVVPIPHTEKLVSNKKKKYSADFLFWWPGAQIREDKGLSVILQFLSIAAMYPNIKFVIAECAKSMLGENKQILYIPSDLSRTEYVEWMQKVDLVLLPYTAEAYTCRTSGVFVEAISLGAIPVVTKKTWMSSELERFGLSYLTFDWSEKDLFHTFCTLSDSPFLTALLEKMRMEYRKYHSEDGFAQKIQEFC